mmetsp:Transcript_14984/g.27393  ORF Transcript_14984/g.27393 Transcript_14984/m.27393 type:complete len:85 (+) Transcript_14984:207-461(+)
MAMLKPRKPSSHSAIARAREQAVEKHRGTQEATDRKASHGMGQTPLVTPPMLRAPLACLSSQLYLDFLSFVEGPSFAYSAVPTR